jgi:class 3 adenylate cyclase
MSTVSFLENRYKDSLFGNRSRNTLFFLSLEIRCHHSVTLGGRIVRGIAEQIDAVVWFSDLSGFTRTAGATPKPNNRTVCFSA